MSLFIIINISNGKKLHLDKRNWNPVYLNIYKIFQDREKYATSCLVDTTIKQKALNFMITDIQFSTPVFIKL